MSVTSHDKALKTNTTLEGVLRGGFPGSSPEIESSLPEVYQGAP